LLAAAGRALRRRPWTAALLLAVVLLTGAGAVLAWYIFHQWDAAQAAVKEGRQADAQRCLDVCLFVWPRSVPVHLLAARAARMRGDFAEAEAHLNRCLKLQNGSTEDVQLEFLLMRVQGGEADAVAPLLLKYVDVKHPESALILQTLSRAYMHNMRLRPALDALNRWIQLAPDQAQPYFWRGWVLERLNATDEAMKDYLRSLDLDPDLVAARLRVAEIFLDRSNAPEALRHLERLRHQCPDRADVMARLGQCLFLQGHAAEARQLLEAAVEKLPDDAPLLVHLAKLELDEAPPRPVEAEKWLRRLLQVDPYDQEGLYTLVSSLRLQGRQEEAAAALERYEQQKALLKRANKLLQDEAEHPTNDPAVAAEAGTLLLRIGQDRLGLYWLHQALEGDPGNQPAHRALTDYYERKGDREQAAAHRRQLRDPKRPGTR
jgi:tetratricopeptide (TPR) repeat protein